MIFAQKINKIPEFLHDFYPKNARILHNNCPKNIFPEFLGGTCPSCSPISYAYEFVADK